MIQRNAKINAMRRMLAAGLALLAVVPAALAGPFFDAGGKAATPTQYVITFKTIEFRNVGGAYYTFFSGSQTLDIGSSAVAAGGVGGSVGSGQSLPAGRYDAIRVTFSRDFSITASATGVGPDGPAANCGTGGSTDATLSGYTVQVVNRSLGTVTTTSRTLSIPPQANTTINGQPGMAVVGAANDIQVTNAISAFTVLATDTVPPAFTVQFDVTGAAEFLNNDPGGGVNCYAIMLPPTVTYITPTGTTTYAGGL
jgi:predicted benzoate:H+ symporter BenE